MEILGQGYDLHFDETLVEKGLDGQTSEFTHEIFVRPVSEMLEAGADQALKEERFKEVLRHEIIHAYFFESGLDKYSLDETLVDWIAVQFPKIEKTFKSLNCN